MNCLMQICFNDFHPLNESWDDPPSGCTFLPRRHLDSRSTNDSKALRRSVSAAPPSPSPPVAEERKVGSPTEGSGGDGGLIRMGEAVRYWVLMGGVLMRFGTMYRITILNLELVAISRD